ncbi:expressed unknown protein [Seminavis robusta]|uniref:Uncharacterized protein n=1 Tax=Seminavis robusta TaxID=568900 RepID=A0A9N8HKU4_9STRA|nr:expressed unknown protein [Seminavis robusta]|eukprot:Sro637_g179440.1 n/a (661) ;mRNA; r:27467-29449
MSSGEEDDNDGDISDAAWEAWLNQQREETQRRLYGRDDFETISVGNDDNDSLPSISTRYSSSTNESRSDQFVFADAPKPPHIANARMTLSMLFANSNWHAPEGRKWVFSVLQEYPALAGEVFADLDSEFKRPLSQLLSARANLEMIQTVYNMQPDAISKAQGYINDLPLHDACWFGNDPEVVKFIATEYPEALTIINDSRRLPIHDAIRSSRMSSTQHTPDQRTNSETIRFLLDMYPGCMQSRDNDGKSIIESALYHGYDPELLAFMINGYLPASGIDSFQCSGGYYSFDLPRAQAIHNIFAHVKSFRCDPPSFSSDGFIYLMNSLACNTSLESMEILSFPGGLLLNNPDTRGGFIHFIEQNQTLQTLSIVIPSMSNLPHSGVCLQVLETALTSANTKSNLQRLELGQMLIMDRQNLTNFLLHARAPTRELVFEQVTIRLSIGSLFRMSRTAENAATGRIRSVTFNNCPMDQSTLDDVFELLAMMPSLRRLKMEFNPSAPGASTVSELNLTVPLMSLLEQNRLESVELSSIFSFDLVRLVDILKTNISLETLQSSPRSLNTEALCEILQQNTTLKTCALEPTGRHDKTRDRAIHLMRLNEFGRGTIRQQGITKTQFLATIVAVNEAESLKLPIQNFNVVHGLLRESPSFWCGLANLSEWR